MTSSERNGSALAPVLVAGASVALALSIVVLAAATSISLSQLVDDHAVAQGIGALFFALAGAMVLRDAKGNWIGILLAAAGLIGLVGTLAGVICEALAPAVGVGPSLLALASGMWTPTFLLLLMIPLIYPDGRPRSRVWVVMLAISIPAAVVSVLGLATSPFVMQGMRAGLTNPLEIPLPEMLATGLVVVGGLLVFLIGVVGLVGQFVHLRHAAPEERARLTWLITGFAVLIIGVFFPTPILSTVLQCLGVAALVVGIVRYQLFDIESVLSRGIVYAVVLGAALLAALGTAWLLGAGTTVGIAPAVAAAATALALAGAFHSIKRSVDRLLFGRRHDPVGALAQLGERLAATPAPEDVLPMIVQTLRESLRLPYAAITLDGDEEPAASDGTQTERSVPVPLEYGHRRIGWLTLGLRRGDTALSASDLRLVATFATQASAAAHATATMRELRRSREEIVAAREEERRSLRRELHDGVGPILAGTQLGLESLSRRVGPADEGLVADLLEQSGTCLAEVRRISRDLRPAALDELGLGNALTQLAEVTTRMAGGHPTVDLRMTGDLTNLPAAVEVAAYRIVSEALSNVTQHAKASTCTVEVYLGDDLILRITDDGTGFAPDHSGMGLRTMRQRAEELGGSAITTFRVGIGTTVEAVLPVAALALPASDLERAG